MLVLLIIFMVAAPLATVDVTSIFRPRLRNPSRGPISRSSYIKPDLSLSLGDTQIPRDSLGAALDAATGGDKSQRIFLRGDKSIAYGSVMDMMNLLRKAGYLKIALVGLDLGQAPAEPAPSATPTSAPSTP